MKSEKNLGSQIWNWTWRITLAGGLAGCNFLNRHSPTQELPPPVKPTVATLTPLPTALSTVIYLNTATPVITPTQESIATEPYGKEFQRTLNPDMATNIPTVTVSDLQGPYAAWAQRECVFDGSSNVAFDPVSTDGIIALNAMVGDNQALNSIICSIAQVKDDEKLLMLPQEDMFIVSQVEKDKDGNEVTFQMLVGKRGLDRMEKIQFFTIDKNMMIPRFIPVSKFSRQWITDFITGGTFDVEAFYESQGTSIAEVERHFQAVKTYGFRQVKDDNGQIMDIPKFFNTHVLFGVPLIPLGTAK